MLKVRLQRRGKKNYATYRVVVADANAPIKGRFVADLGHYNPHTDEFSVDGDSVKQWITNGAQVTPTVHNLLIENKVISGDKVTSWRPKKKEGEEGAEQTAAAEGDSAPAETEEADKQEEKVDETPEAGDEEKKEEA